MTQQKPYQWAIVGAGPAGIASLGLLLDSGIQPKDIIWIDPDFKVGHFGQKWGEVSANTKVSLFRKFLDEIDAFEYAKRPHSFPLDSKPEDHFIQLKEMAEPLQWITDRLLDSANHAKGLVTDQFTAAHGWTLSVNEQRIDTEKVILAIGSMPKVYANISCPSHHTTEEITLADALNPNKLDTLVNSNDTIAVFGSSHSAMIIIRTLVELGVKKVINFYQSPLRYAVPMRDWTLYDNSGLKGETAKWTKENISKSLHPKIERYKSNHEMIEQHLPQCTKTICAIGFQQYPSFVKDINFSQYDSACGIIAPALFGTGIAFPQVTTTPFGHKELNIGLYKFLKDIKKSLPLWMAYGV